MNQAQIDTHSSNVPSTFSLSADTSATTADRADIQDEVEVGASTDVLYARTEQKCEPELGIPPLQQKQEISTQVVLPEIKSTHSTSTSFYGEGTFGSSTHHDDEPNAALLAPAALSEADNTRSDDLDEQARHEELSDLVQPSIGLQRPS